MSKKSNTVIEFPKKWVFLIDKIRKSKKYEILGFPEIPSLNILENIKVELRPLTSNPKMFRIIIPELFEEEFIFVVSAEKIPVELRNEYSTWRKGPQANDGSYYLLYAWVLIFKKVTYNVTFLYF